MTKNESGHKTFQTKICSGFDAIFMPEVPRKLVLGVNALRRNERAAYQKGVFLCPVMSPLVSWRI